MDTRVIILVALLTGEQPVAESVMVGEGLIGIPLQSLYTLRMILKESLPKQRYSMSLPIMCEALAKVEENISR